MRRGAVVAILAAAAAFILGNVFHARFFRPEPHFVERVDTLTVYKESFDSAAFLSRREAAGFKLVSAVTLADLRRQADKPAETVEVPVVEIHDSLVYVRVPMEERWFEGGDSVSYRIHTRGYETQVLDVRIKYPYTEITRIQRIEPKRWSFAVTAGPSALVTPSGGVHGGLGLTAGISMHF